MVWLVWILSVGLAGELDLEVTADDFVLTASIERGVRRVTARMFSTYDDVLGLTFPAQTQIRVRLIEDRAAYDREARALGLVQPTLGFFSVRTGEGVVWRNTSEAAMRSTLVHEASHFLMTRGGALRAPLWLHEGMATLFGHARLSGNAVYLDPPPGIGPVLKAMDDQIPSIGTLVGDPAAFGKVPATSTHGPAEYSVGWSLCAFLMSSDRGKAVLRDLLRASTGSEMVVVIERWPGGLRAFDRSWRAWSANPRSIQLPIRVAPASVVDGGWIRCDSGTLIRADSGLSCPERR